MENFKFKDLVQEFLASKKNSNSLLELEKLLLSNNDDDILQSIKAVSVLFTKVFEKGLINFSATDKSAEDYASWLFKRCEDFNLHLVWYLSYPNYKIQKASLQTLMLFLQLPSQYSAKDFGKTSQAFPRSLFMKIVSSLASPELNLQTIIKVFEEYTHYNDIRLYLLKTVEALFAESTEITDIFLENCFLLLCSMKFPKDFDETSTLSYHSDPDKPFKLKEKSFRKLFSAVWNRFLNFELSEKLLKKVLCILHEDILPNMQNPCILTDFLTNAYNKGGVLSLLALKGLFFLMQNYNLEYPGFFIKLYSLVDKDIMNGKFNSVFFTLLDLFLSSTHLPAHIVAAFVKKLSRLSLILCTSSILKSLHLISNLLANHVSLTVLLHRTCVTDYAEDPYKFDVLDPSECNVMESSLWEIKTLQSHINPDVSCKAKELTTSYPKISVSMSEISKISMYTMYTKQRKRKFNEVPLAICLPTKQKCA